MSRFIHLRAHTSYSLLEGMIHVTHLIQLCKKNQMPAFAITDSNNMFCALEASMEAKKYGIQIIPGCECDLEEGGRIVLLAQSEVGYKNLLALVSCMYTRDNKDEKNVLTVSDFEQYHSDLILLTGGVRGPLFKSPQNAEILLLQLKKLFFNRLYLELDRPFEYDKSVEALMIRLAYEHDIPLVATNTFFFESQDMCESWNALRCIETGEFLSEIAPFDSDMAHSYCFKTEKEMIELFSDLPEAIENTVCIAKRCYFMPEPHAPILPSYRANYGKTEEESLCDMAIQGLKLRKKFDDLVYQERLNEELSIIIKMGFSGYFLIVADFVQWAKDQNIPVGPGRGSGVGSVVAWALRITELDPLQFNLLFERFLNPERVSMPDFDIDLCGEKRDQVIHYVQQTYGFVAGIITFGTLQARAVLRDVGRVLGMPYGYVDRICRLVPQDPANPPSLKEAFHQEPMFKTLVEENPDVQRLFDISVRLEGLYRHVSTHAGGIVMADRPLSEIVPLYRDPRSNLPVTGFHMKYTEAAGLVKFDLLGLKTLTMIQRALQMVKKYYDHDTILDQIPLNDLNTYSMLASGDTIGVFQLESQGMRDVLVQICPSVFEDLIAVVALYRPGPMENLHSYIRRKKKEEPIVYEHPILEDILKETVGIPVYQEQVMQMAQKLAGYTLGSADLLRRAMGKKIKKEMDEHRTIFCLGAKKVLGMSSSQANRIFDQMSAFAGYGFNKGHAAAYAYLAYQTAWLKANYPVPFLAASMIMDIHNTDKLNVFRMEALRMNIIILPPDIRRSDAYFCLEKQKNGNYAIRYGLGALKNVGVEAAQKLIQYRNCFNDLFSFIESVPHDLLGKRALESLIKSGALDCMNYTRSTLYDSLEKLLNHSVITSCERNNMQKNLFQDSTILRPILSKNEEWPLHIRLKYEFEAIGMYLTTHPLESHRELLSINGVMTYTNFTDQNIQKGFLAGVVEKKRLTRTSHGGIMAFITLSDETGIFEVTFFSHIWKLNRDLAVGDSIKVCVIRSDNRLIVEQVFVLDNVNNTNFENLEKDLYLYASSPSVIKNLKTVLQHASSGHQNIFLSFHENGKRITVQVSKEISITHILIQQLKKVIGVAFLQKNA